eukprot:TRINITY_DN17593_c3_g1_i1.p1 TRINITY_DN17593_c3_g1~~TRINITY_DN17593_c3_g1_i1.p1  ORF type:complete len:1330 (+),score=237.62 TRINITY_DN17593_c3_g1_i1:50-3991(+)
MEDLVEKLQEKQAERALFVGKKDDIMRLLAKLAEIDEDFEDYKVVADTSEMVEKVMENFEGTFEDALVHLSSSDKYRKHLRKLSAELDWSSDNVRQAMTKVHGHPFIFSSTQASVPEEIGNEYSAARVFTFDDDDENMSEWFDTTMEGENIQENLRQMGSQLNSDDFVLPETQITLLTTVAKAASEVTDTSHWAMIHENVLQVVFSDNEAVSGAATNAIQSIIKVAECWQVADLIKGIVPKAIHFHTTSDPEDGDPRYQKVISTIQACLPTIISQWAFIENLSDILFDICRLFSIPIFLQALSDVDIYASWFESLIKEAGPRSLLLQSRNKGLLVTCSQLALCKYLDGEGTQINNLTTTMRVKMMIRGDGGGGERSEGNLAVHCITILALTLSCSEGRAVFPINMGGSGEHVDFLQLLMFATRTSDTSLLLADEHLAASTALHGVVLHCLCALQFNCYLKHLTTHLISITHTTLLQQPFAVEKNAVSANTFLLLNFLSPLLDLSAFNFQEHNADDTENNQLIILPEEVFLHLTSCLRFLTHLTTVRQGRQLLLHTHAKGILPNETERLIDSVVKFIERSSFLKAPKSYQKAQSTGPVPAISPVRDFRSSRSRSPATSEALGQSSDVVQSSPPPTPSQVPVDSPAGRKLSTRTLVTPVPSSVTTPSNQLHKRSNTNTKPNNISITEAFEREILKLCKALLSDPILSAETSPSLLNSSHYSDCCTESPSDVQNFTLKIDSLLEGMRCATTVQNIVKQTQYNKTVGHLLKRAVVRLVTQQNRSETLCLLTLSPEMLLYTSQLPDSAVACRRYHDECTPSLGSGTCLSAHYQGMARWAALRMSMLCSSTWLTKSSSLNAVVTSAISGSLDSTLETTELSSLAASCAMQLDSSLVLLHKYDIQRKMMTALTQQDCGLHTGSLLRHIIYTSTASIGGPTERRLDRRSSSGWNLLYISGVWCEEPDLESWGIQDYNCNLLAEGEEEEFHDEDFTNDTPVPVPHQWLQSSKEEPTPARSTPLYQHSKDSRTLQNLSHAITQAESAKDSNMSESNQEWLHGIREIYSHAIKVEPHNNRIHSLVVKYMCAVHGLQNSSNQQQQGVLSESHSLSGTASALAVKYGISLGVLDSCDEQMHCTLLKKHLTDIDWAAVVIYFIVGESFIFASKLPQLRYFGGNTTNTLKLSAAVEFVLSMPCASYPELPQILNMLSVGNVPVMFVVHLWTRQLFLNFLDWPHLVSTVTIVLLFGVEYLPLIIVAALHHMKYHISDHLATYPSELSTFFAVNPIIDQNGIPFSVSDSLARLHDMRTHYDAGLRKALAK